MQTSGSVFVPIPHLVSYQDNEDLPCRNEAILKFKDLIDIGRYIGFLDTLPEKEQKTKMKQIKKIYPDYFD